LELFRPMSLQTQPKSPADPLLLLKDRLWSLATLRRLYVLFWILNLADLATCLLVGLPREVNPLLLLSARHFGIAGVVFAKVLGGLAFTGLCVFIQKRNPPAARATLAVGSFFMAIGFLDNSYVLSQVWTME